MNDLGIYSVTHPSPKPTPLEFSYANQGGKTRIEITSAFDGRLLSRWQLLPVKGGTTEWRMVKRWRKERP